jgi:preprotein translocase subunit SecE
MLIKDKIINGISFITLLSGYFVYDQVQSINPNYSILAMIAILLVSLGIFSFSTNGKDFWNFFKDVKSEFGKIHFPQFPEVVNGLGVVFIFCAISMAVIWFLDGIFLNAYNMLM